MSTNKNKLLQRIKQVVMLLFKRIGNKKVSVPKETPNKLFVKWNSLKQKIAMCLQKKSQTLSVRTKKFSLIFFCLLFGGSSIAIIIHSTITNEKPASIAKISKPLHATEDSETFLRPDSIITKKEYERVLQFKNYLLHLRDDSIGRKKYDSITINRPQLMDSITLFEKMYLSQNKK
jgi:hypothetical protein